MCICTCETNKENGPCVHCETCLPPWVKCEDCDAYVDIDDVRRSGGTCPNCQSTSGLRPEALTGEVVLTPQHMGYSEDDFKP